MSILCLYVIVTIVMTDSLHLYAGLRLYCTEATIDTFRFNDPLNLLYTTHVSLITVM
jgi:hypothetical protein